MVKKKPFIYLPDKWFFSTVLEALKNSEGDISDPEKVKKLMENIISESIPEIAERTLKNLKSNSSKLLKYNRRYAKKFEKRLYNRWKKPIDLLEMFLHISGEVGSNFNNDYRQESVKNNDLVFEVLTNMHGRACDIVTSIISLLKSGHADEALTQWRTLYEISVYCFIIKQYGQDIAEKFMLHEIIDTYRLSKSYEKSYNKLGHKPISKKKLEEIENKYNEVLDRFGKEFKNNYGWALDNVIKKNDNSKFYKLAKKSGLEHLYPYYIMACHNVHAGAKSLRFKLGLIKSYPESKVILAGPSNYGLADPGQLSAISIHQITTCLLTTKPTMENLISLATMKKILDEICGSFCKSQSQIEQDEEKLSKK